ncbi:MAG: DedA family protein [Neomegalonema sp.]|nr:DedA family protein [Neomegalonema sp.]
MLRALYNWTMRQAETPYAMYALAIVAFIESSIFPIPPDVLMIPMIIARPHRAWAVAAVATISSVLGGVAGYALGYTLEAEVARPILEIYGKAHMLDDVKTLFERWGELAVLGAGVTPFPYKVITIGAGVGHMNLASFMIFSVIARGLRFFVIAALLWKFGAPIRDFIEKRFGLVVTIFFVLTILGLLAIKYVPEWLGT